MSERIIERDPGDPKKKDINPLLKLALELGPLLVFFFANTRGEWLAEALPDAGAISAARSFIATALFMVAMAISLAVSWVCCCRTLQMMPLVLGRSLSSCSAR